MSLYSYNPNDRYRQRAAKRWSTVLFSFVFFTVSFVAGIWFGELRFQHDTYILREEKRILSEERDRIQKEMTVLRAEAQTANVRLEQLKANYDSLFSDGAMKKLVTLVRTQIDKGVAPERLESVLLAARPPQNCSEPETRRFVAVTPVYKGPSSLASIKGGDIVIYGTGVSAKNAQGKSEAWFDPGQPVEVFFKRRNGEIESKKGLLPLYHSVVMGGKEYRFNVMAGDKSFVKISYDNCDFP